MMPKFGSRWESRFFRASRRIRRRTRVPEDLHTKAVAAISALSHASFDGYIGEIPAGAYSPRPLPPHEERPKIRRCTWPS